MQTFNNSIFSYQTVNFLIANQNERKAIDNIRVILHKFDLALFTRSFPLIYSRHLTILGSCYCKKQIDVSLLCVCSLIKDKCRHNNVKVYLGTTRLRLVAPQPLSQYFDAIYHQLKGGIIQNWHQFVTMHAIFDSSGFEVCAKFLS